MYKKGYAAVTTAIITLIVSLTIVSGLSFFSFQEVNTSRSFTKSVETKYVSESGTEDAIYRLVTGKQLSSGEQLGVGGKGTTTITIDTQGNKRIIRSEGTGTKSQQNLETRVDINISPTNFAYGAMVGDGGITMANNARIEGSLYSNGNVTGSTGVVITGDTFVAAGSSSVVNQSWETRNADQEVGTVEGTIVTVVDNSANVGEYNSLAIGTDGFARIAYYDATNGDLKFARCLNADCNLKNIMIIDSGGNVGYRYTGIALGADGFAQISYYDATNKDLKFVHCTNADCTTKNIIVIDSSVSDIGQFSSLVLGTDGFSRIAYYSISRGDLRFARCLNIDCTSRNIFTVDSTGDTGKYTSVALGSDGFARISYQNETSDDLKMSRCLQIDCQAANNNNIDTAGDVGSLKTNIAMGSDGYARIGYYDDTNRNLKFVRCTSIDCNLKVITVVDSVDNIGKYNSMQLGADGFARISYWGDGSVKFARCTNADCTTKVISITDTEGDDVGHYSSLRLGSDGFGRISYYDNQTPRLKFARCRDQDCSPANPQVDVGMSFRPTITATITQADFFLRKAGSPANPTVRLIRDVSGSPSANPADVLATAILNTASVGGSYGWANVYFSSQPTLTANTTYWLVIDAAQDTSNYLVWGRDSAGGYTRGSAKKTSDWTQGGWANITGDLDFRAYMGGSFQSLNNVTVNGNAEAQIMGTVTVGGNANAFNFDTGTVTGNINADSISNCTVVGNAAYNSKNACTITGSQTTPTTPPTAPAEFTMPITDQMITAWKNDSALGGTCIQPQCQVNGDFAPTACAVTIGPKKIIGNLILDENCQGGQTLTLNGTVWVTGNIDISNNAKIILSTGYGDLSGIVVADGTIHLANNGQFNGSGIAGSYLMLLSTALGGGHHNSAIDLHNNASGAIFYAHKGLIYVHNNVTINELAGYALSLDNNVTLIYEIALQNVRFSSGPAGGFDIKHWKEVE